MGLSLIEFGTRISEMLDERVTKNYKNDYETELSKTAGMVQQSGETFYFLARVSSKTNNVEVYERSSMANGNETAGLTLTYGGLPLLDTPATVLQTSLGNDKQSHDDALNEIYGQSLSFSNQYTNANVGSIMRGTKVVSAAGTALNIKNRIWEDHEALFTDIPELTLSNTDIKLMARYCSSRSNMPAFAKMYDELAAVEQTKEKGSTLYVQSVGETKRVLRYNPAFIAKAILQDMLAKKVGLKGMEKYGGAMASLAYMIGHEMLHVIYNHFDKNVNQGLKDMQLPPLLNKSGSKELKRVMGNTVPIEELMNNRFMSAMFDMPAVNGGYTVPEYRDKDERRRGSSFESMTAGRWYMGNAAVFPNTDKPENAQAILKNSKYADDESDDAMESLVTGAGKINYDKWVPVAYHVESPRNRDDYESRKKMPKEHTFFADSTVPLPTFMDLELLMRRSMAATNTDEELVKLKPTYADQRKPDVNMAPSQPEAAQDDTTLGDLAGQDVDDEDNGQDPLAADDEQPKAQAKTTAKVQDGDIALDKALGIYRVVIGVVEDGDPQELLTYPVTKLPTDLSNKIMKAVQGHKDTELLDAATLKDAEMSAKQGGSPHAAVRLSADSMASVAAIMAGDDTALFETLTGDKLRPVYMDVRDSVDVDPNQEQDSGGDEEPQPDVEINNNPDVPPPEDQEPEMGGGGGGDGDDQDGEAGGDGDADGEEEQDSDSGDGSQSGDDQDADQDADQDTDGDSADGDSADGDSADGDSADGDSADGDSADGDSPDGDSPDGDSSSDADGSQGDADSSDDSAASGSSADSDSADSDSSNGDSSDGDGSTSDDGDSAEADSGADDTDSGGASSGGNSNDAETTSAEQQEQEWDDYLKTLGNDLDSTTLGSNDDSSDAVERPEDTDGDGTDGDGTDGDGTDGDGTDGDGTDDDGTDGGKADNDFDQEALFDRTKDDAEQRAERKRKQQLLKDQLDALNDIQAKTDKTMDKNRNEREASGGTLSSETQKKQAASSDLLKDAGGSGSGGGFGYGGKAKADKSIKALLGLISDWARLLKGKAMKMDVGYNSDKISRRIKGAWGGDDDMPVRRGRVDKALIVIFDTSGSLSGSADLISKTIAATLEALHKKMGVSYVIPISFDGKSRKTGIYTVDEIDDVMPRFMAYSDSAIEPAFDHIIQVLKGTARLDRTSYKGDGTNINIGGILLMTDFDVEEYWRGSTANKGDIPIEMTKYLKPSGGNKTPWLNLCWLVDDGRYPKGSGLRSISFLKKFHSRNIKMKNKFNFSAVAANQGGIGVKVRLSNSGDMTPQEISDTPQIIP